MPSVCGLGGGMDMSVEQGPGPNPSAQATGDRLVAKTGGHLFDTASTVTLSALD